MTAHVRITDTLDGVVGVRLYQVVDAHGAPVPGPRVALIGRQHGNEPVGEAVLDRLAEVVHERLTGGAVVAVIANLAARALNLRHTPDGVDMNRLWDADRLATLAAADPSSLNAEERRVRELAPLVVACDVVLDLHSTSRPSPPHLLFRDDLHHARLAGRLGVTRLITGIHESAILDGGLCSNAGLRAGEPSPKIGLTLEAGQHDNPENLERAWGVVTRLLTELGVWRDPDDAPAPVDYEVFDIIDRFVQAPAGTPMWRFVGYEGGAPGGGRQGPPRHLESFDAIEADEVVLRRDNGEVLRAESPYTMLMPAPTAGPGEDLFFTCQRRHAALQARAEDDATARIEALAIERMTDLLAWDDHQRGTTVVTVSSRRTLDLCAELVARTARLPVGHPHRRVVVVGRGDWGGTESEQRAGLRWGVALRRALDLGVPIERIQLLRGTSMGWLQQLVDDMSRAGSAHTLCLATRQPHTVSVVLVGDPALALETGELRHVGVALLVEALSVEPDGDEVHTSVARAGLFGARPELVRAAVGLVDALRAQHIDALETGLLGDAPVGWLTPSGALSCPDPASARALGEEIMALQRRQWRRRLASAVTQRHVLEHGQLGGWLARLMVRTGIYDADALRAWLVRPHAEGWLVDPLLLADPPSVQAMVVAPRSMPTVVVQAQDVTADNIDRWTGWKRTLRDVQALPGHRGRDLDVAFEPEAIQRRVARWMDDARQLAVAEPGQWLVAIAGDGLSPHRDRAAEGWDVLAAHRKMLLDPHLRYLRIQHAQGAHLAWMKDFVDQVRRRGSDGSPVALGWETEHGGSINVMVVARHEGQGPPSAWDLDPWTVVRATVLVSGAGGEADYQVALFTEPGTDGKVNQELVHFARRHCQRLIKQSRSRFVGTGGPMSGMGLERSIVALVTDQIAAVRAEADLLADVPPPRRARWVARRHGLLDPGLAARIADAVIAGVAPEDAAAQVWAETTAWPGELWEELNRLD